MKNIRNKHILNNDFSLNKPNNIKHNLNLRPLQIIDFLFIHFVHHNLEGFLHKSRAFYLVKALHLEGPTVRVMDSVYVSLLPINVVRDFNDLFILIFVFLENRENVDFNRNFMEI